MEEQLALIDRKVDEGMKLDGQGLISEAILKYEEAVGFLDVALKSLSPDSREYEYLKLHRKNLIERLQLLQLSRERGESAGTEQVIEQMQVDSQAASSKTKIAAGAGAVAGVGGLIVFGPLGLITGGALAAYLTLQEGKAGDISRKVGETTLTTVRKAKEVEQEHHLLENTKKAAVGVWDAALRVNEKYHVTEKISNTAQSLWTTAKGFNEKHHVTEKVASGVSSGMNYVAKQVSSIAK
eukprot:GDKJ01020838.1.p1 GENE.GDKJ01020838.1~~GDKJ01020838.1.p1  ORF type:complete len:239 (-),score=59.66 GDKJ01020838.1:132-848(-)